MRSIINTIFAIIFTITAGKVGLDHFADYIREEALTKVHRGLPSLSSFTNKLTGGKFDEKMNYIKIKK